jgi:hypothetical protein
MLWILYSIEGFEKGFQPLIFSGEKLWMRFEYNSRISAENEQSDLRCQKL